MRTRIIFIAGALVIVIGAGILIVRSLLPADLVRTEIEQQLSAKLGQPVHVASASAFVLPQIGVDLHDFTIGQPAAVQLGRVRLVTGLRGLLSRRVEDASIVIENGRIQWPLPFAFGGANGQQEGSPSVTIASVRQIQFRNITIVTALPPITVDLDASLSGDRVEITRLSARSERNRLEASGAVTSLARLEGRFQASGELTVAGYTARNFNATITVAPAGISLSPMTFGMFDGKFDGGLTVDLRHAVPQAQLRGQVSRLDVAEVVKNTVSTGGITGRLVGAVSLICQGTDGASLVRSARGNFHATVVDGTLPYLDMVRPVVLAFGKPSGAAPSGSGSAFSSLAGNFTLSNATLASQNLTLEARDFSSRGTATLNLASGALQSHVDLVLSQELTAQAGTDLRRYAEENGRVVVPATVGGTMTHPTVFVDTTAAMKRAAENEVKRKAGSFLKGIIK
jgi:uncharacterized protein involved in outer membrane biogenesis